MRKHTSCDSDQIEEQTLKKQKLQKVKTPRNKEIYSLKQNSFRMFNTPYFQAFCLHATEPLIAISTMILHLCYAEQSVVGFFTLDGDLITVILESSFIKRMYLSATMMITSSSGGTLTRYNDYNVRGSLPIFFRFGCDMNNNIYTPPIQSWEIVKNGDGISTIDIYSPDFEFVKSFKIQVCHCISSICIREDTMAILSQSQSHPHYYVISRYSLSNAELLESVIPKDKITFNESYSPTISFDPFCNIFISCNIVSQLAVWYVGGRIRYYKPPASILHSTRIIGQEMSEGFQLILAISGSIRIYEDKADIFK